MDKLSVSPNRRTIARLTSCQFPTSLPSIEIISSPFSRPALAAILCSGVCEDYDHRFALRFLNEGKVVIFCAGTGNPFFTTDTAACLRGIEIGADLIIKATKVDGVYSADPVRFPDAELYEKLSYTKALEKELGVMDLTAFCLARDHGKVMRIFNMNKPGALRRVVSGEKEGTTISCEG